MAIPRNTRFLLGLALADFAWAGGAAAQQYWPASEGPGPAFYGQINQAYLHFDDGLQSGGLFSVDNANNLDGSSIGLLYDGVMANGWNYSARAELAVTPRASDEVSLQNPAGPNFTLDADDINYLDLRLQSPANGTFYVGQGDMTANLSAPDYSGTSVVAGPNMGQIAGGMRLRYSDGVLSDVTLNEAIGTWDSGRKLRLRYDSPSIWGVAFSGSVGVDVEEDDGGNVYSDAQVSYTGQNRNWQYQVVADLTGSEDDGHVGKLSFGYLHASGLNLTVTLTQWKINEHYKFYKVGYIHDFFDFGATAISIEYYNNGDWLTEGSEMKSSGISIVQYVDNADLQIYASLREYDAYTNVDTPDQNYLKGTAVMAGLLWQF